MSTSTDRKAGPVESTLAVLTLLASASVAALGFVSLLAAAAQDHRVGRNGEPWHWGGYIRLRAWSLMCLPIFAVLLPSMIIGRVLTGEILFPGAVLGGAVFGLVNLFALLATRVILTGGDAE